MPSAVKYKTQNKPSHIFVLLQEVDVVGAYERKIDAQNDAIKYNLHNYLIIETEFK